MTAKPLGRKLWVKRESRNPDTGEVFWTELHDQQDCPLHGHWAILFTESDFEQAAREIFYFGRNHGNTEISGGLIKHTGTVTFDMLWPELKKRILGV